MLGFGIFDNLLLYIYGRTTLYSWTFHVKIFNNNILFHVAKYKNANLLKQVINVISVLSLFSAGKIKKRAWNNQSSLSRKRTDAGTV